ncbi:Permease of the major facilitator superfamily [Ceraceosorus bombacis]|uniref:Permease of the major facilitator superfamily n=1 Tax=Ceraceosorus bombacis TaxID=401625 RepID=A0A0P1BFP3_9BASI|nr:Permease of the major facilitator superfamily [Ceraceosorus bombacis]
MSTRAIQNLDVDRGTAGRRGSSDKLSWLFLFMIIWVVASTFNYGFGISELNALASALTCPSRGAVSASFKLPVCFEISSSSFGIVTALFTFGGLLASLLLSPISARLRWTRRQTLGVAATINCLGTASQAFAPASWLLGLGRGLMGMSAGIAIAVVPAYLNDLAPPHLQGSIGVLNQLSIVIGILIAQALGVSPLGAPASSKHITFAGWRWVPIVSFAISLLQLLCFRLSIDSPREAGPLREKTLRARLAGRNAGSGLDEESEEQEGLLDSEVPSRSDTESARAEKPMELKELIQTVTSRDGAAGAKSLRKGVALIVLTQLSQQLSGVNAVLYYSSSILSDALGAGSDGHGSSDSEATAKLIALGITIINALMTFPPLYLVSESRLGRKSLLLLSAGVMCASNAVLAVGIVNNISILSALSIVTVVAGFSLGLGPVPFLILPELVEPRAVTSASALGVSLNWTANLLIASFFLPLRNLLASVDGGSGGSVFAIFAVINAASVLGIQRWYAYEWIDQHD